MDKQRLQKLAGIITENSISEYVHPSIPYSILKQRFKYVGKTLEIDPTENVFDSLEDFFTEIQFSWDASESEVEKYINSLSYENGKIVSNLGGKKTVELMKQ